MNHIIELRSKTPMAAAEALIGHAITELPQGAKPGMRETAIRADDDGLDWYLARCAGRREHKAEAALIEAGVAVYLPRIVRKKRQGPDRIRVEEALFGGYIFAGVERGRQTLVDVESADLVYNVVRFDRARHPRPLAFAIIRAIHDQELRGEFDRTNATRHKDPKPGEPVSIVGGKFQGFPATFLGRDDEDRVRVLLKMLGTEAPLTLEPEQVGGLERAA